MNEARVLMGISIAGAGLLGLLDTKRLWAMIIGIGIAFILIGLVETKS